MTQNRESKLIRDLCILGIILNIIFFSLLYHFIPIRYLYGSPLQRLAFGTVRGNIVTLDPHYANNIASRNVIDQVVEQLYQFDISDPDFPIVPWLALAMPIISPDGTEYTIPIRQGVKFHDGTPMNATAVKWSFDRLMWFCNYSGNKYLPAPFNTPLPDSLPSGIPTPTQLWGSVYMNSDGTPILNKTIVIDPTTIKFVLNQPRAAWLSILCFSGSGILSLSSTPANDYLTLSNALIGTGPFIFTAFRPGMAISFDDNPDYWQGRTQIDSLTFLILPVDVISQALLSGDIDLIDTMDASFIPQFKADPDVTLIDAGNTLNTTWISFNYNHNNITMRRALSWCFNYSDMIDVICKGEVVRWPTYIPFGIPYANYSLNYPIYNITKARDYLLNDPGYGATLAGAGIDENSPDSAWTSLADTTPLENLNYTYDLGNIRREDIGNALATDARHIGVKIDVVEVSRSEFLDMIYYQREKMDMYAFEWASDYFDPEDFINPLYSNISILNGGNFYEPDVQALMNAGIAETDPIARDAIYQEIQRLMVEEYLPSMTLYTGRNFDAYRSNIAGWSPNPFERLWFYPLSRV